MALSVSPLAPKTFAELPPVPGVRFATAEAGIKYNGRTDVLLVALEPGTAVAGVLTRSLCPSAAVDWCRENLAGGKAGALLVNSGNANAFTGMKGMKTVEASALYAADAVGCAPNEVFLASTGVIGEPLDASKFEVVTREMAERLVSLPWIDAAKAIMTTDTFPKMATATVDFDGVPVVISGIAKGSGMIAPDMATMLSFIFTDAPIAAPVLQRLLTEKIATSFNAITVDSDTSTSDTCLAFATGRAIVEPINDFADPRALVFGEALGDVLHELALLVVRDGEGATKLVTVNVGGATTNESAFRIAQSIANSPLVKTAIADRDKLSIAFGDVLVAENGERAATYDEEAASAYMQREELEINVALGLGTGVGRVYTCDLTHGYIDINGSYRS
jgi:glutamate N-acetyltransferase/amino-acid N-acetyltransferase